MDDLGAFYDYYVHVLGRKRSTATRHTQRLRTWQHLTGKAVTDISSLDVIDYLRVNPLEHAGNTKKGQVSSIQAFHRFEVATQRKAHLNGICEIGSPSTSDEDSPPPLESKYVETLLAACRKPLEYRVVYGGLFTGMRIGESGALHGSAWRDDAIWLKGEKSDKKHPIPVHPRLEDVKWEMLAHRPTDPSTMQRVKRRIAARTGVRFKAHQLRKRFAQSLRDEGVGERTVGDLLGHSTVTAIYATTPIPELREAILRLPY